jgi:hypothetical protein
MSTTSPSSSSSSSSSSASGSASASSDPSADPQSSRVGDFVYWAAMAAGSAYLIRNAYLWLQWPEVGAVAIAVAEQAPLVERVLGVPLDVHKLSWGGRVNAGHNAHMNIPVTGATGTRALMYCKAFWDPESSEWKLIALQIKIAGSHQYIDVLQPVREDALTALVNEGLISENNAKVKKHMQGQQEASS